MLALVVLELSLARFAHLAASQHFASNSLGTALEFRLGSVLANGVYMLQIGFEESDVAPVCEANVFVLADLLPVPVWTAESV
jgi:hypothetical protein